MRQTLWIAAGVFVGVAILGQGRATARPSYFDANCMSCHTDDSPTCNGCHHHGLPRIALTDLDEYEPGSTVTVTLGGPADSGWNRALLYDDTGVEIDRVTGPTGTGDDGTQSEALQYPFVMVGRAPLVAGTYTWEAAWWGSPYDTGNPTAFPHGPEVRIATNSFTVSGDGPEPPPEAAEIELLPVSPRTRDRTTDEVFDLKSSGLDVVGINKRVYLMSAALGDFATSITDYTWSVVSEPSPGAAVVDVQTSSLLKFHPSVGGEYMIEMTPQLGVQTGLPVQQRIYAAKFVGTGTLGDNTPAPPQCGTAGCHGDRAPARLNKLSTWNTTRHAHKLENHLEGNFGSHYATSCLECHTLGYDEVTQDNDNFQEIAQDLAFDLNVIPPWVDEAATSGIAHWNDLPAPLQLKSNIQCESCHGPGSDHNGDKAKIVGPRFDAVSCQQCHDSASGYQQQFYQFGFAQHLAANQAAGGHVQRVGSCHKCHIGEGFVHIQVRGESAIPDSIASRNAINCIACHDPHDVPHDHQVRKANAVTLPDGTVFDGGLGNLCANCHNTRVSDPAETIATSFRGAHHGPQAEVLLATGAYGWGQPYPVGASVHAAVPANTCVTCHMAEAPAGAEAPPVGAHTFAITTEAGDSNVANACGDCHPGLTTTDRMPLVPVDYNGDGFTSGIQTEVGGVLAILQDEILSRVYGTHWDSDERRITISEHRWGRLPFDIRAVLYNFNLCSEEKSLGVHNAKYVVAVLQRSYRFVTGRFFREDYPQATLVDTTFTGVRFQHWREYR